MLKDLGRTSGPSSPNSYLIIDGQQRLTTLYLLFAAMAKVAQESDSTADADFIWQTYLAETKSPSFKGQPKLVPRLQDRATFWAILEEAVPTSQWDFNSDPAENFPKEAKTC